MGKIFLSGECFGEFCLFFREFHDNFSRNTAPSSPFIWRILSVCVYVKSLNLLMVAMFYKATLENPVLKDLPSAADQNKAALRSAVKICGRSPNQEESFYLGELHIQDRDPCLPPGDQAQTRDPLGPHRSSLPSGGPHRLGLGSLRHHLPPPSRFGAP